MREVMVNRIDGGKEEGGAMGISATPLMVPKGWSSRYNEMANRSESIRPTPSTKAGKQSSASRGDGEIRR